MKKFLLLVVALLLTSACVFAQENGSFDEIDQEMIELLDLDQIQAVAYVAIMEKQRKAFLALKTPNWQLERALYQQTFHMLRPVLTKQQHARFVGIIDSVIEDRPYSEEDELLAMEAQ